MAATGFATKNRELVLDESPAALGKDGREAGATCLLLLASVGGELSDQAVVWSDGTPHDGPHDSSRVELPLWR